MSEPRPYRGIAEGKWVKGWYCFVPGREYSVVKGREFVSARHFIIDADETEQCLDRGDDESGFVYDVSEAYEVIPETVGQFTGRKDKKRTEEFPKGQEVYAGDKVKFHDYADGSHDEYICKFGLYNIHHWGFFFEEVDNRQQKNEYFMNNSVCEVIGSIHDHLLKGAE